MLNLFDTHAHLSDEAFDEDRDALIPTLPEAGVGRIIDVACDIRTAERTLALLDRYQFIYGTVGMHPHDVSAMNNAYMDRIAEAIVTVVRRHEEGIEAAREIVAALTKQYPLCEA